MRPKLNPDANHPLARFGVIAAWISARSRARTSFLNSRLPVNFPLYKGPKRLADGLLKPVYRPGITILDDKSGECNPSLALPAGGKNGRKHRKVEVRVFDGRLESMVARRPDAQRTTLIWE
jgi:hypothetical protein